ncbi:hypothetical protein [Peterkaempfera bronchialis]|uniref:Uncharacterized protein n=1 Tax=Peterkaempfera bronchialis TaxID=2126346 RepID=A0A345T0Y0_9ACTN|nr:hypothetical protein [Peterkaempfera bronchialis]AXI79635.1 hypothetical protein C7M71_021725 [Peterkaempfera bronchialis]
MFYLRLARGYRVLDLGRWILTAAVSAAAAALLLRALGRALVDPPGTAAAVSAARLGWCLPPLAVIGWLSAACARALPGQRPERIAGLTAAGAGPVRIRLLVAGETALACTAGSLLALLGFLVLRNDIAGATLAPEVGMGTGLPTAAPLTLLLLVPLMGAAAAAGAVPARDTLPGRPTEPAVRPLGPLRTVVALAAVVVGVAIELYGLHSGARPLRVAAGLGTTTAVAACGWALALLGLALTVPLKLSLAGRLLVARHPRAARLLAGRGLEAEALRLGTPLGLLSLTLAAVAAAGVRWATGSGPGGPLPVVEAVLIGLCAVAAVGVTLIETRTVRRPLLAAVRRLGAPAGLLRSAALLRAAAASAVVLVTATAAAGLTALALSR